MSKLRRKKIHKKILTNLHPNEDAMVIGQIIALENHIRNMKQGDQQTNMSVISRARFCPNSSQIWVLAREMNTIGYQRKLISLSDPNMPNKVKILLIHKSYQAVEKFPAPVNKIRTAKHTTELNFPLLK